MQILEQVQFSSARMFVLRIMASISYPDLFSSVAVIFLLLLLFLLFVIIIFIIVLCCDDNIMSK